MSKLIIVVVPDHFNIDNTVSRIKINLPKEGVHVIPAESYQAVKEIEKDQHNWSVETLESSGHGTSVIDPKGIAQTSKNIVTQD